MSQTVPGLTRPAVNIVDETGTSLNGYILGPKVGEGVTAKVYAATAPDGEPCALKVYAADTLRRHADVAVKPPALTALPDECPPAPALHPVRPATILDSVCRELCLLERLRHPNIITSLGVLASSKKLCLVMPLLSRPLLTSLPCLSEAEVFRCEPVALHIVWGWANELLQALRYLHEDARVSHGDIRHDNVCVDASNRAVLVDFGCFKERGDICAGYGSLAYSPPECVRGESAGDFGAAADVWALGILLCTAITGRFPYSLNSSADALADCEVAPSLADCLRAEIAAGRVVLPASLPASVADPVDLEWIWTPAIFLGLLAGMLQPDPARRFTAARALAQFRWGEAAAS
jgi:serine/threonine protein kinase